MQPWYLYMIGLAIAFFGAMAGVLIFGYESKDQKAEAAAKAAAVAETGIGESAAGQLPPKPPRFATMRTPPPPQLPPGPLKRQQHPQQAPS